MSIGIQEPAAIPEDSPEPQIKSRRGEPTWEVAYLFPKQGEWTETEYLALNTNRLIELSNGCLEFLPMPTPFHQLILTYLYKLLDGWVSAHSLGMVFFAGLTVRLWEGEIREPDVVFLRPGRIVDVHRPPNGADLAMEVVSPGAENHDRDLNVKREVYAQARIAEYWIVDPAAQTITVLTLDDTTYREHGVFRSGTQATSVSLPGFSVDVTATFAAGQANP